MSKRDFESNNILVLIVAGGLGTRSKNPTIPKILQEVTTGKRLISFQLEQVHLSNITKVKFLLSFQSESVISQIREIRSQYPDLIIDYRVDLPGESLSQAVLNAMKEADSNIEMFTIVLGDVLHNTKLTSSAADLYRSEYLASVLVHPNLHPDESDTFLIGAERKIVGLKLKGEELFLDLPQRSVTGVFFCKKRAINSIDTRWQDISRALIQPLFAKGQLLVKNSIDFFQDTGTPERLLRARKAVESGRFMRSKGKPLSGIFLDRDGTLVPNIGESRNSISRQEVDSENSRLLAEIRDLGIPIFLVTNQPGIAKGFITELDFLRSQAELERLLAENGAIIDDFEYCPHHPERGFPEEVISLKIPCFCRKPNDGMIRSIESRYGINLESSIFIGDSNVDLRAAKKAGMEFLLCKNSSKELVSLAIHLKTARKLILG